MRMTIASAVAEQLIALAARSSDEICGLVFASGMHIDAIEPAANVAATPGDSFEIDPAVLFTAARHARAGGRAALGCYHSHPTGAPVPSARDVAGIGGEGEVWLIVAADRLSAWRAVVDDGARRFDVIDLALASPDALAQSDRENGEPL